ncbi:MAG: rhodanese-like domain-containing protein [Desulfobacteraceae bacterium]|nr:rhodanese-like domain-containing protein [Desulfobacteraceae bacterium]
MIKRTIYELCLILLISTVIALSVYAFRTDKMPFFASGRPMPGGLELPYEIISLEKAISHFENTSAIFADARSPEEYRKGHISGARNLSVNHPDDWIGDFFTSTAMDTAIITYCHGEECPLAKNLAAKLREMGFEKIFYLEDGWGKWKGQSLPSQ